MVLQIMESQYPPLSLRGKNILSSLHPSFSAFQGSHSGEHFAVQIAATKVANAYERNYV